MSRILAGVLAGCLVLAVAGVAGAGIPDPDLSNVALSDNGLGAGYGLTTCPDGDGPAFQYVTVTAKRADTTPIEGIPSGSFFFVVTGGEVTISAVDSYTDSNGEIRFEVIGDETIVNPTDLTITAQIYTVVLSDTDYLRCNTYDYDAVGGVTPTDFGVFAADLGNGSYDEKSDFDWSGAENPSDFGSFAGHFGHGL